MSDLRFVSKELKWILMSVLVTLVITCTVPFIVDPRWWYRPGNGTWLMLVNSARWIAIIALFIVPRMIENQIKIGKKEEARQLEAESAPAMES